MSLSFPLLPNLMPMAWHFPVVKSAYPPVQQPAADTFTPSQALGSPAVLQTAGPLNQATLSNGMQGYFVQKPGVSKSELVFTIPTKTLPPGISDLLCQTILDGSPATVQRLQAWGRQGVNLFSVKNDTDYSIHIQAPAGEEANMAAALTSLLTQPVVDPAKFNTLKAKLIQSQKAQMTDPDSMLDTAMARRIFGAGHPYSLTPQERIADYSAQTLNSVMACHSTLLQLLGQGKAMMISPMPVESQRQAVDAAFRGANLGRMPAPQNALINEANSLPPSSSRAVLLPNNVIQQALIKVLWQVPDPRDPDYPAFCILRSMLSGFSQNSFLKTLRTDHSLLYGINCNTGQYQLPQGNTFTPSMKVDFSNVGQALADIRQVTQALCQKPIPLPQLQAMQRAQLLEMREGAETASDMGSLYEPWLTRNGATPPDFAEMQAAINRVTPLDLQRVANRVFNDPETRRLLAVSAPTAVLQQWFPGQPIEAA